MLFTSAGDEYNLRVAFVQHIIKHAGLFLCLIGNIYPLTRGKKQFVPLCICSASVPGNAFTC